MINHLFTELEKALGGKRFSDDEEVQEETFEKRFKEASSSIWTAIM